MSEEEKPKKLPRDRVKTAAGWIVGTSIAYVIYEIVDNNVTPSQNKTQAVCKWVGRGALSWAIQASVQERIDAQIDSVADAYVKAKKELEDKRKSSE